MEVLNIFRRVGVGEWGEGVLGTLALQKCETWCLAFIGKNFKTVSSIFRKSPW